MKKGFLLTALSLILSACFFVGISTMVAQAETQGQETVSQTIVVRNSDILRGARSNVNRQRMTINIVGDGVVLSGIMQPNKLLKMGVKSGTEFTEEFSIDSEILQSDANTTFDLGFIYGDIDEVWLDPWDFMGIDMNDPGSLAKFKNIGGFTVRFSTTGNSISTLMMKGIGDDLNAAAFALAGVTQQVPFAKDRNLTFVKENGNWVIKSGDMVLPFEDNATKINPSGRQNAQEFINSVLDSFVGKQVYPFIASETTNAEGSASFKIKGFGGKQLVPQNAEDPLLGDTSYQSEPTGEIEFSLAENYYMGLPEYADRKFTYLSQSYMDPTYTLTENGLKLSGRDKLYGVNADLTYLTPFEKFDGFSAVLGVDKMPKSTLDVNSCISMTLIGQPYASYYAWNSIYVRISFPFEDYTKGFFADVMVWGEPTFQGNQQINTLLAEMPTALIPYNNGDIVVKVAKTNENHYIYVNGVRFGDGFETAINLVVNNMEKGFTNAAGSYKGFYFNTLNVTAYMATGLGLADNLVPQTPAHYIKQINGNVIVNKQVTLKTVDAPYVPSKDDVTKNSIALSFSGETPDRTDGNYTIDGYVVERYKGDELDGTITLVGKENRAFTDENLVEDTRYTYRVYAVQGVETDSPIKLVAYKPITVKTLGMVKVLVQFDLPDVAIAAIALSLFIGGGMAGLILLIKKTAKTRKFAVVPQRTCSTVRCKTSFKPLVLALALCVVITSFASCGPTSDTPSSSEQNSQSQSQSDSVIDSGSQSEESYIYELETMLDTFENLTTSPKKSGVMYNETVLMLQGNDGKITGKLAFKPLEVLRVCNYSSDIIYKENEDYTIDDNGVITLTEDSTCPFLKAENLIYNTRPQGVSGLNEFPSSTAAKPNIMYTETAYIVQKQICVTYRYDTADVPNGVFEKANENKLPALRQSLAEKKTIRLAVLGDSISEGANSSGKLNIAPYQPAYSSLFRQYIEKTFGVDVEYRNYSLGGMASEWAINRAYGVGQFMPDLVIISFGTNDGGVGQDNSASPVSVETFVNNIKNAIANIRKFNPNCEFIYVSPLVPNPLGAAFGIQGNYADAMESEFADDNTVLSVDMYHMHEFFLTDCGKGYADMSSNNVNHPNDFLMRLYTQNIISAIWQ